MVYRPSHISAEAMFTVPAEQRPFIDLSMARRPGEWPPHLRRVLHGPTRWGNLIVGLATDEAASQGIAPARLGTALATGSAVLQAVFHHYGQEEDPAEFTSGMITADGDDLRLYGFVYGGLSVSMRYIRAQSVFVPVYAAVAGIPALACRPVVNLPVPLTPELAANSRDLPPELRAASEMGKLEQVVTATYPQLVVDARVTLG